MKIFGLLFLTALLFILSPTSALAAKKRVWKTTTTTSASATRPTVYVSLRKDRLALNINFSNLNLATSTSYELTYTANGIDQGVYGSAGGNEGNSAARSLYFGTCSHAVCTPHTNIQSMALRIEFKLKTGKTLIKKYKIRV